MDLLSYQRAFMRMSLALEPAPEDLALVGSQDAALLYRHMIRTRLEGMARVAFKVSWEVLGEGAFGACFARYLAAAPPHSSLIREVIADFGPFARVEARAAAREQDTNAVVNAAGPAFLVDLLCFEEEKWRLAYVLAPSIDHASLRELDFEGAPLWNPLLRVLSFTYPVHTLASSAAGSDAVLAPDACVLFTYRPPGSDEVRWYKADPFFAALVRQSQTSARSGLGELIPVVAEECGIAVDQELLESLATSLTLALERGVLLGVLDHS